jgi:hypothetical protein
LVQNQNELLLLKNKLEDENHVFTKKFQEIDKELSMRANLNEVLKFRRYVDQLEQIVNLVYGLEIRIQDAKQVMGIPYNLSMLSRRLEDARRIKERHDQSLLSIEIIVKDRLGESRQIRLSEIKRLSETNICNRKMVGHDMYVCDMQFKLINLFG